MGGGEIGGTEHEELIRGIVEEELGVEGGVTSKDVGMTTSTVPPTQVRNVAPSSNWAGETKGS